MKRNVAVSSISQINPAEIALAFGGQHKRIACDSHPTNPLMFPNVMCNPPLNRRRHPNESADQFFKKNRLPVPWISVPDPYHTFLMVA